MARIAELFIVLDTKLEAFNKGMSDAEKAMVRVGKKFEAIGKKMTMMVTLPILAVGAAAVKMGADFEQSMMNAASVSGATGEELKRMEGIARDMGETTVFSARQAADAMYFMASAGWKVNDMGKAIKPTLDLAAATQSDLAFATDTVVASLNQFQLGSEGAGRLANVFAAAIGNSQATMEKLSISMRYVGPLFHSMGKEVEEAAATLMVLYNAGYDASMAGTALRMGMVKLMDGTKKTTDALDRLNLSLKDVDPTTMHFADIIEILGERGAKTKDVIDIFGVRAGPAFAALISQGGVAIRDFEKGITGTNAAAKMAEMQINTLKGSFKLLTSALTESAIQIFKLLGPGIKDLVDNKLKPAVLWFNSLSESTKKTILVIGGLAAAAGPLLLVFGKILVILPKIKLAFVALTGPIGMVSAALLILGPRILNTAIAFNNMKDLIDKYNKTVGDSGEKIPYLEKRFLSLKAALGKLYPWMKLTEGKQKELNDAIENAPKKINPVAQAIEKMTPLMVKMVEKYQTWKEKQDAVTDSSKKLVETQKTLIEAIEFTLDPEMKLAQAYDDGSISLLEYTSKMRELRIEREKMADDLADLELAEGEVNLVLEEQENVLFDVCEALGLLPPAYEEVGDASKKTGESIKFDWESVADDISRYWQTGIAEMIAGTESFGDLIFNSFKIVAAGIGSVIGDLAKNALKAFGAIAGPIGSIVAGIATAALSALGSLLGIKSAAQKEQEAEAAALKKLEHAVDAITKTMSKYGDITEETAKKITESRKSMKGYIAVSKYFGDVIRDVGVNQENINNLWERATGIIGQYEWDTLSAADATNALNESFKLLADGAKELGEEGSAAMIKFIQRVRESGLEVASVTEYVIDQLDRIPSALETLITAQEKTGQSIEGLELRTLEAFKVMEASGMSWTDIVHKMSPALNALRDRMEAMGHTGSQAIQKLFKIAEVTEANKDLFDAIEADRIIMEALGNTGWITGEILNSFARDAIGNYEELKRKFGNSDDALRAMGPTLQKLQDYSDAYNITLDEGTRNLINQAVAIGIVKREQESSIDAQKRMFDDLGNRIEQVMDRVGNKIVEAISGAFGTVFSDGIAASEVAADAMTRQMGRVDDAVWDIKDTARTVFGDMEGYANTAASAADGLAKSLSGHSVTSALEAVLKAARSSFGSMSSYVQRNSREITSLSNNIERKMVGAFSRVEVASKSSLRRMSAEIANAERTIMSLETTTSARSREALSAALREMGQLEQTIRMMGGRVTEADVQREIADTLRLLRGRVGAFQGGGIAWTPQVAMVAEKGPEIIMPLREYQREKVGPLAGEIHTHNTFNITTFDGESMVKIVENEVIPILNRAIQDNQGGFTKSISDEIEKY